MVTWLGEPVFPRLRFTLEREMLWYIDGGSIIADTGSGEGRIILAYDSKANTSLICVLERATTIDRPLASNLFASHKP